MKTMEHHTLSRRRFLAASAAGYCVGATARESVLAEETGKVRLRMGVNADPHLLGRRAPGNEANFLLFVEEMKRWKPDFAIDLGDFGCQVAEVIGEQVVITIVGVGLMFLALMVGGALSKGGLLGLFSLPVMVGVIAGGYALVGMMMYEMEFGTGFGYGFTILTLHVLTTWGIIKFL